MAPNARPVRTDTATLGGGCFWCTDAVFSALAGVHRVVPGYSGGSMTDPTYAQVVTGTTGHAEVVQITFDPAVIAYRELLDVFFATHDPTTLNRQGADVGTQYRSVVFTHSAAQRATADAVIARLTADRVWDAPIVTRVEPFTAFYPAEPYHRDYYRRHPDRGYCRLVIAPKVAKLRRRYAAKLNAP
jgi:peptide-methionine (S)-S-oxide reductase